MRYVIVGAGAIGGVLGGRLAQHSAHPPLLIARGRHGEAIASRGLRLRSPDDDTVIRVPVAAGPDEVSLQIDDVLIFATKTQSVELALREWVDQPVFDGAHAAGTAGELLPAFMALNGVESERIALRYFARVFGVCVWLPGVYLTPGEVAVRIAPSSGTFIIGRCPSDDSSADADLLATLRADWTASTFRIFLVDDVARWKHRKLLSNLGNVLQALLGPDAPVSDINAQLRQEAEQIFRSAGIAWASAAEEETWRADAFDVRPIAELGPVAGSSWQSLQRGTNSIETDYLNGEIVLLARQLGLGAPLNAVVQRLARRAAAGEPTSLAALTAALRPAR
jgi:2-dehydropantoate 2-reductase